MNYVNVKMVLSFFYRILFQIIIMNKQIHMQSDLNAQKLPHGVQAVKV